MTRRGICPKHVWHPGHWWKQPGVELFWCVGGEPNTRVRKESYTLIRLREEKS